MTLTLGKLARLLFRGFPAAGFRLQCFGQLLDTLLHISSAGLQFFFFGLVLRFPRGLGFSERFQLAPRLNQFSLELLSGLLPFRQG